MGGLDVEVATDWRDRVEVQEDPELARRLRSRLPPDGAPRAVSVTDLTGLRPAFFSALEPVPVSPERRSRFALGRAIHRGVGSVLAEAASLEVRVRRSGIVGRIDVLSTDDLVEIKTASAIVPVAELVASRPDQVEQVAMYAALADRDRARLLTLETSGESVAGIQAADLRVADRPAILAEMVRRRDLLRRAWNERRADELPRCRWFGRGCEFQEAQVCTCTGTEPGAGAGILGQVREPEERSDVAAAVRGALGERRFPRARLDRFRDLLYLRRTYFERTSGPAEVEPSRADPAAPADLYERLREAMESGPLGESASRPLRTDELDEDVPAYRDDPWIERVTRAWRSPAASDLMDRYPQYGIELAFRCVATGARTGRLVIGWERASNDEERLRVFALRLTDPTGIARLWRERVARLERAVREAEPGSLPACPSWMFESCPYAAECGCGGVVGRSQR